MNLVETMGFTGTEASTLTYTATSTLTTTQTATTILGSGGTITSGTAGDSLYETGSDSASSNGTGANVRQYAFSGASGNASTYNTTYSVSATGTGLSTLTKSDAPSFGAGGVITSGSDIEILGETLASGVRAARGGR